MSNFKSLGCSNSWAISPFEIVMCKDKKHVLESKTEGKNLTKYTCPICEFYYLVDSSGRKE